MRVKQKQVQNHAANKIILTSATLASFTSKPDGKHCLVAYTSTPFLIISAASRT